jgi:23S rRNA (cytidine1920-2'-O)/16S rRNA (cytidine1409-2'-O)-methyltransferase
MDISLETGFGILNLDYSPIRGPEGNIEYLLYLKKNGESVDNLTELIEEKVRLCHEELEN